MYTKCVNFLVITNFHKSTMNHKESYLFTVYLFIEDIVYNQGLYILIMINPSPLV